MSYRALDDVDNKIINAVQYLGAREGAQNVTAKKIAAMCDISDFAVFSHFGTKKGYLDAARESFYQRYLDKMRDLEAEDATPEMTWDTLINDFIENPDGPAFYVSYISTFGMDDAYRKRRANDFLPYARRLIAPERELSDDDLMVLWNYMSNSILFCVSSFVKGNLECNDNVRGLMKNMAFHGLKWYNASNIRSDFSQPTNKSMTSIYRGLNNESPYGKS